MKFVLFAATAAVLAGVGVVAASTPAPDKVPVPTPFITLTTDFPADVDFNVMPPGDGLTTVAFKTTLTNTSRSDITLTAGSDCAARSWRIIDAAGKENQKKPTVICPAGPVVKLTVPAGKSVTGPAEVVIQGKLMTDKAAYTFEYSYFGHKSENKFTARVAQ